MYENRFSLHRKPFQSVLNDQDFFRSEGFEKLSSVVLHALRSDLGVAVLTGPVGAGKSAGLEAIRRATSADCQTVLLRGGAARTSTELLHGLHRLLLKADPSSQSVSSDVVRRWDVVEKLQRRAEFWGPLVLLLDDAHLAGAEVFAELRSLLEEEVGGQKLVRLLIAGPLPLEEVLAQPAMEDFAQKIRAHVFLQPLRLKESVNYLKHHIRNCGGRLEDIFDGNSVERIVTAADGLPRCLNLLTDESLMICEETNSSRVTVSVVDQALGRLQHLPVAWNIAPLADDKESECEECDTHRSSADSVIEIGGPARQSPGSVEIGSVEIGATPTSSPGVIEIGAEPRAVQHCEADSEVHAADAYVAENEQISVTSESDSVIEIGGLPDVSVPQQDSDIVVEDEAGEIEIGVLEYACDDSQTDAGLNDWTTPTEVSIESDCSVIAEDVVHAATVADLGHHLLLASSQEISAVEEGDSIESSELFGSDGKLDDGFVDFEDFVPWKPAGQWPASAYGIISDYVHPDSPIAHDDEFIMTEDDDVEALQWPEEASEPVVEFLAVQDANLIPVFDRFTWCELNRPVTSLQKQRRLPLFMPQEPLEWPPKLAGVVPLENIAIEILGDSTPQVRFEAKTAEQSSVPRIGEPEDEHENPYHRLPEFPEPDPELTIDQIQELLHTEIFETDHDHIVHESSVEPRTTAEESATQLTELSGSQEITDDELSLETLTDVFSLPVYTGRTDFLPELTLETEDGSAEQQCGETLCHHLSESAVSVPEYKPRLLRDARTRVDSEPDNSFVEQQVCESDEILILTSDVPDDQSDDLDGTELVTESIPTASQGSGKARFRDLFTRLRKMQNRSA